MSPITCDTAYFGGIEINICTWSAVSLVGTRTLTAVSLGNWHLHILVRLSNASIVCLSMLLFLARTRRSKPNSNVNDRTPTRATYQAALPPYSRSPQTSSAHGLPTCLLRKGFGAHAMEVMIRRHERGVAFLDWHTEGLACKIAPCGLKRTPFRSFCPLSGRPPNPL